MKFPSNTADVALIDWTSADARHLTLGDIYAWEDAASRHRVVEPMPDEEAWERTDIAMRRSVL